MRVKKSHTIGQSIPENLLVHFKRQSTHKHDLKYLVMCYEVLAGVAPRHEDDEEGCWFGFETLKKAFGNKCADIFKHCNTRFEFLDKHVWFHNDKKLVSYRPTAKLYDEMGSDILKGTFVHSKRLVDMLGKPVVLKGAVLRSKTKKGTVSKRPVNKAPLPKYVTVDREALHAACSALAAIKKGMEWRGIADERVELLIEEYLSKRNPSFSEKQWATRQQQQLGDVCARANIGNDGKVGQQYEQSAPYGRWYANRGSVLAKTTFVRKVAYLEHYHYDIANCGLTIAMQLTDEPHPHVQNYIDNKVETRRRLAELADIPVSLMKQIITAHLYKGSVFSEGITKSLSNLLRGGCKEHELKDKVEQKQKWIASKGVGGELFSDIRKLNNEVLEDALAKGSKSGRKSIVNAHGFEMVVKSGEGSKQLACIIQGWESYLLKVLMDCPYVVGCQTILHDGWTTDEPMDIEVVQQYLYEKTGFLVKIEQD